MVSVTELEQRIREANAAIEDLHRHGYSDLRQVEMAINRVTGSLRQLTGSSELGNAMAQLQRMLSMLRLVQYAYHAVMIARMSAGDPLAWISAGATLFAVGVDIGTQVEVSFRGT